MGSRFFGAGVLRGVCLGAVFRNPYLGGVSITYDLAGEVRTYTSNTSGEEFAAGTTVNGYANTGAYSERSSYVHFKGSSLLN